MSGSAGGGRLGGFRDTSGEILVPNHSLGIRCQAFTSPSVLNPSKNMRD